MNNLILLFSISLALTGYFMAFWNNLGIFTDIVVAKEIKDRRYYLTLGILEYSFNLYCKQKLLPGTAINVSGDIIGVSNTYKGDVIILEDKKGDLYLQAYLFEGNIKVYGLSCRLFGRLNSAKRSNIKVL